MFLCPGDGGRVALHGMGRRILGVSPADSVGVSRGDSVEIRRLTIRASPAGARPRIARRCRRHSASNFSLLLTSPDAAERPTRVGLVPDLPSEAHRAYDLGSARSGIGPAKGEEDLVADQPKRLCI